MDADRMRQDCPLDLSPVDPLADPARFAATLARLRQATGGALRRRRAALGVWGFFARWRGPICAVSGLLAASSLLVLTAMEPASSATTLAEAAGVPDHFVAWTRDGQAPTPAALLELGIGGR